MEHMAWKGRIKPGCKAEYQRRHAEIWPEMVGAEGCGHLQLQHLLL